MSETVVLQRPDEQQFDAGFQQPELNDVAPHLTEDVAAAQLAAEASRPDYLQPDEKRELISQQDRQDYETYVTFRYNPAAYDFDDTDWEEASKRLRTSDNPYTQMLMLCEDVTKTLMTRDMTGKLSFYEHHPVLKMDTETAEMPRLVAEELAEFQQAAQEYLLNDEKAKDANRSFLKGDPELRLEAARDRLRCSLADQMTVKTVSAGRFVSEAIRTVKAENLPDMLVAIDSVIRQAPGATVDVARTLAQVDTGLSNVERDEHMGRSYSQKDHAAQKKIELGTQWYDYESASAGIPSTVQGIVMQDFELTQAEFTRINNQARLFDTRYISMRPKDLLKHVIDNPDVIRVVERLDDETAPRLFELLDGVYVQARVCSIKDTPDALAEHITPDGMSHQVRMAMKDVKLDERYTACIADLMSEIEKVADSPDVQTVIENPATLVPGRITKVFTELQPETAAIMLKNYPALLRHEGFPEIAEDLFYTADFYERISGVAGAREVTGEVFAELLAKVEHVAAIKPELLEEMTFNPFDATPAYRGLAGRFDTIMVSENYSNKDEAWLTDVGLEKLLAMSKDIHGEELRYLFQAVAALTPRETDLRKLYTNPEKSLDELYDFWFSGENLTTLLAMYNRANIKPEHFHFFKHFSLERETVEYITSSPKVRDVLTRQVDPKTLESVIAALLDPSVSPNNSQTIYVDAVTRSFEDFGEYANQALFSTYYAVLRGNLNRAQKESGMPITKEGQAGIDQLKAQLMKFRDEVLGGTVDVEKLESSPVYLAYFKSLVRYESSEWGNHDDGSFMMLLKEVEYARSEQRTELIDAEAYHPSQEMPIAKVDQAALDAFEITKDSKVLWRDLAEDIRTANAIVFFDQPQILEGVISEIDEKVRQHIKRLEGGREKLEQRLLQVPEEKQPKLQASIEALNVQIAELRDTTQGELMQTSKIIRHLRVLSQYDDMKSPLRRALFTATLMKYPNEQTRVARLLATPSDKVKLTDLEQMSEFVQHMTNQETWGPIAEAFEMQKGFNRILEINAINEDISRGKNIGSAGARNVQFIPTRDALMELSGHIGDACWANRYHSIARQFANFTSIIMVQKPGTKDARLMGAAFLIEAHDTKGEPVLVIRGLNPIQNVIEQLDKEDFFNKFADYARGIAEKRGMKLAVVIDGHYGGSGTNRPGLFTYMSETLKPQLKQVELAEEPITEFNGYDIREDTYLL